MEDRKLRHMSIILSAGSKRSNDYVLGRITGIVEAIIIDGGKGALIVGNPKTPESYILRLKATDDEFDRMRMTLQKLIGKKLAKIDYYNVKSKFSAEEES